MRGAYSGFWAATASLTLGCASTPDGGVEGAWELTRINGQTPAMAADLRLGPGTVGGTAFCNTYGGDYAVRRGRLVVGAMHMTQQACAFESVGGEAFDPMAAESSFLQILQSGPAVRMSAGRLVLQSAGGTLEFRERAQTRTR